MNKRVLINMIGTTHFDPVWMWCWDEGMSSIRATFRSALDRMNEDGRFIYSFSSPPVFEWIREVDPAMFAEIKKRVAEGRWELVEGWWVQPHCFGSSGESYIRQGLYGQRYLMRVFGIRSKTAFNTDSFGHCATLPQILRLCGMEGYVFGRPSDAQQKIPSPLFKWRGIDGSAVSAFRFGGSEANAYSKDLKTDLPTYSESVKEIGHDVMMVYGVSNHGGAPTKASIAAINAFQQAEKLKCDVKFSRLDEFFEHCEPPMEYDEELITSDFGVYINSVKTKQNQRKCETALVNAEKAALLAHKHNNRPYPKRKMTELWHDTLFNQFHDIIGGASVPDAMEDARNLHGKILWETKKIINYSLQSISKDIDTSNCAFPLIAWNLNAFDASFAMEAEFQWAWEFDWYDGPLAVYDSSGRHIPSQIIQESTTLPRFRSRLLFEDELPSLGYALYNIEQKEQPEVPTDLRVDENSMENSQLKVIFSRSSGGVESIIDKTTGDTILTNVAAPIAMDDPGCTWAFNMGAGYETEAGRFTFEKIMVLERGPLRAKVRIISRFGVSKCEQEFSLRRGSRELEGKIEVFWGERHKALKIPFHMPAEKCGKLLASTPYGWIERKRENQELPMGDWLNVAGTKTGFALVTKGVSAYSASESGVELTLLRSPIFAHLSYQSNSLEEPAKRMKPYRHLDQGEHVFQWKLMPCDKTTELAPSDIERSSMAFNNPPVLVHEASREGGLQGRRSYLNLRSNGSILTALKMAEDGDDIVVRMVEFDGANDNVRIESDVFAISAERTLNPHEILTLKTTTGKNAIAKKVNALEE